MQRLIRTTTLLALVAVSGCQQGSEEDWELDEHLAAGRPVDIDDIEHVDELPALEGEDALRQIALDSPPREEYEFVGYAKLEGEPLWVHDAKPEGTVGEVLEAAGIKLGDALQGVPLPPGLKDTDAARGILVSADGRVFVERLDAFAARLRHIASMREEGMSGPSDEGWTPPGMETHRSAFMDPLDPVAGGIHGSDQRKPVTTSSYPDRAVGVAIVAPRGGGSVWSGQRSVGWVGDRAA